MHMKFTALALAASALVLSGCVVQPADGTYVQQQPTQQSYQAAPQQPRRGPAIEGPWFMTERGQVVRPINVARVRGGIEVESANGVFPAQRIERGVFQGERGGIYQFYSATDGRFENPKNGRVLRMVRPQR